jgi:hypothetical protein
MAIQITQHQQIQLFHAAPAAPAQLADLFMHDPFSSQKNAPRPHAGKGLGMAR